jgi:transmembrane sensor
MKTDPTYPVDLITSYFAGEATPDDLTFLAGWLKADPKHREFFESHRKIWANLEKVKIESQVDLDKEWNDVKQKTDLSSPAERWNKLKPEGQEENRFFTRSTVRLAALFLLFLIPMFLLYMYMGRPETKILTAESGLIEGTLPDGTSFTLNKGGVIEYPEVFKSLKREVKLTGEAWFEVEHDNSKPFIISSGNVRVEVMGTSFYVNTRKPDGNMEVILATGKVALYYDDQATEMVILAPGEKADINVKGHDIIRETNDDPNFLSWKTHRLIFDNDPLVEVVGMLNRVYHARIRITDPVLANCRLTATFDNQTLESVLNVVAATLDLKISRNDTWTEISGKGCN